LKLTGLSLLIAIGLAGLAFHSAHPQAQAVASYEDIAPLLGQRCVLCHAGESAPLGLRLDSFEGLLKGSSKGPVVKSGDADGSELIRRLRGTSLPRMPMTGPPFLAEAEVSLFEAFVAGGMQRGRTGSAPVPVAATPAAPLRPAPGIAPDYRHVAPIFATRCAKCHTENGLMGPAPEGFRLTSYESTLSAADRVRVVPGHSDASELVRRIRGQAQPRMPMDGPPYLSANEIQLIEAWIAAGARNAEGIAGVVPAGAEVRLHGTLEGLWRLDDLDLSVDSGTRIDKSPGSGDYVEVRGHLDASGKVIAERIRRRQ
jgi:mono/diheme cytochrome c family protein